MKRGLRIKCFSCGHWNKVSVNKIFIEQNTKCGKVIAEPEELVRIEKR